MNSYLEAGIDWGHESGTTLIIRERIGTTKAKIIYLYQWIKIPRDKMAKELAKDLDTYKPEVVKADSRPTDYQGWVEKYTRRRIHYVNAEDQDTDEGGRPITHKAHMLGQLARRVKEHQLIIPIPYAKPILDQMRIYRRGMRSGDDLWMPCISLL